MSLNAYLKTFGTNITEGHSQEIEQQTLDLINAVKDAKNILEIGFNAGHSSETFLTHSLANVVSFDLGEHGYVLNGKHFMDKKFPGRHTLLLGDSHATIPFFKKHSNLKFDILFIDGDHSHEGALNDLLNCMDLAAPNATVIVDDVILKPEFHMTWSIGPTKAWYDMLAMGKIEQTDYKEYRRGRGMVFGKYK